MQKKWYHVEAVSLLKGLYLSAKNEAKFQEFKSKEAAMKASGKLIFAIKPISKYAEDDSAYFFLKDFNI
jgi:hypothetical protein